MGKFQAYSKLQEKLRQTRKDILTETKGQNKLITLRYVKDFVIFKVPFLKKTTGKQLWHTQVLIIFIPRHTVEGPKQPPYIGLAWVIHPKLP